MGFQLRRSSRFGPLRLNFNKGRFTSWSIHIGRWSWNSRTRKHTVDTPGPGYYETRGRS